MAGVRVNLKILGFNFYSFYSSHGKEARVGLHIEIKLNLNEDILLLHKSED